MSYLKIGIFAVAFLLLSSTAYAADNSQWCGLMTAIYGVCSPQLVDNYLMMTKNPPKPPNTIRASAITTYTAVLVKEAGTGVSSPPTSQAGAVSQDVPAPAYRYSWYWSDNSKAWIRSRMIN